MRKLPTIELMSLLLVLLLVSHCIAQEKTRFVEGPRERYKNQPIEIVGWEVSDRKFIDKNRVAGDKDWIKALTLLVQNVSERNIQYFEIYLLTRKRGKDLTVLPVYFQTHTDLAKASSLTADGDKKLGYLRAGETVKVKVSEHILTSFGEAVVRKGVEDGLEEIDHVRVDIREVYFEDGNRWMFGMESRPDPNDPNKRIPINRPEPGLGVRVREWLQDLIPKDQRYKNELNVSMFSGWMPDFYIPGEAEVASLSAPTCYWLVGSAVPRINCTGFTNHNGCQGDDGSCSFQNFENALHSNDPGGGAVKGYMALQNYICNAPVPPATCNSCSTHDREVFISYSNCGSPGTCNQTAWWGCAAGFVDISGICQRSVQFQNRCAPPSGYDPYTCSCPDGQATPTPTPTPTPAPTPWGECVRDPNNYHLCHGSTCTIEINTCNTHWDQPTCTCPCVDPPLEQSACYQGARGISVRAAASIRRDIATTLHLL